MENLFTIRRIDGKHRLLNETGQLIGTHDTFAKAHAQATAIQKQDEENS